MPAERTARIASPSACTIYRAHAVELMSRGQAYHCFCSEEQLEMDRYQALRNMQPPKYVGRCREYLARGRP